MRTMEPAPPRVYPRHCDFCRARYGCVCEIKEKLGYCWTCEIYCCDCIKEEPYDYFVVPPICSLCKSPYECVCQLLIECGNCPTCIHLKENCICEELPCGCINNCECQINDDESSYSDDCE